MEVTWSAGAAEPYDRFVEEAWGGHFQQTRAWASVATAGRPLVARYFVAREGERLVGAALLTRRVFRFGRWAVLSPVARCERGPVCARVDHLAAVLTALIRAARRHAVLRLEVMPWWCGGEAQQARRALEASGFRPFENLAGTNTVTLQVDLSGAPEAWLLEPERAKLRAELRRATRAGVRVRRASLEEMPRLARLYGEMMAAQGLASRPAGWFEALAGQSRAALFLCEHEGQTLAGVVVVRHARTATWLVGATRPGPFPGTKLGLALQAAISWAQEEGCSVFDLGGVPEEADRDPKRCAIARFKRDISAREVRLVPEHRRWTWSL